MTLTSCDPVIDTELPKVPEILATEPLSRQIEEFVGGHAKLVWAKHAGNGSPDTFANYEELELWGIDTRDDRGARRILEDMSNYGRPMVTPTGNDIVFTHKGTHKMEGSKAKYFSPVVFRVDWEGKHLEKLAEGYAVDVWRDPATSIEWVYVADLEPTDRASMKAKKLERFKLLDPGDRELVWDQTEISTENIQLSRDGSRASCLFPWPDAGVLNLSEMSHQKYQHGCWPSLAPDNSYLAWVFDGSHKNLFMFNDKAEKSWSVAINQAPKVGGHEVYHPRWSNHVRFMTMTGPYVGESIGRSDAAAVEAYLGRFDEKMQSIEAWLQITDDAKGDFFPDLWVKYVEPTEPTSTKEKAEKKKAVAKTPEREWPVTGLPLLFVWEDRNTDNRAGEGASREVSVEAREAARFGAHFDMRLDGGYFEADDESAKAVQKYFGTSQSPFTLEVLATPLAATQDGIIMGNEHFQLKQRGTEWVFVANKPSPIKLWIGNAEVGVPNHLVVAFDGASYLVMHNGKTVNQGATDVSDVEMLAGRRGFTFGTGWAGAVEAVSIAPGRLDEARIEASWKYLQAKLKARDAIPRIRLKAKLVEMTADRPVEALDTYPRGLLGYLYEVEEVLEGSYEADKVLVMHWTILDRTPLQSFPRKLGESYELLLEPYTAHRELISERQWNDVFEPLDPYYDVETPKP